MERARVTLVAAKVNTNYGNNRPATGNEPFRELILGLVEVGFRVKN